MTEAALVNQLKFRVGTLQSALSDKQKQIEEYRNIEQQADGKIKVLNKVHAEKIKSLLNSIQILKKEKAAVENLTKQHKRSKLIEQLNKEILDQDIVIEVLRKQIYDQKGRDKGREICDSIIVKALTKGPQRIRPLTREELRMEIDKLKAQGTINQNKAKGTKAKNSQNDGDISEISSVSERSFVNQGEQVFARVRELQGQNESLKLELATKGKIVEKLKAESRERDRLKAQTQLLANQLQVAQRRAQTFERLLRESKQNINGKVAELYTRELRVEELEMNSKQSGERLKQAHESANILLQQIRQQKQQLKIELQLLRKENEQILLQNITLKKRFEQQKNKINQVRTINNKNKEQLSEKLKNHEQALQKLINQHNQLQDTCRNIEAKLFQERSEWVEQKSKLLKQIQELSISNNKAEFDNKFMEQIDQLRKENRDLKELVQSGTGGAAADNSILMQRLESYRMKLQFYEKGQSKGLYEQLFNKYNLLLRQYQELKKKTPVQKSKRKQLIQITKRDEQDLQAISSGISGLHLQNIDSDILENFDSDYEYELKINNFNDKKFKKMPKMTEEDQQLLKLINSDLWNFVKDQKIDKKIEEIMKDQESNAQDDLQLKERIRKLKNISHPMGKKIFLYDSQIQNIDNMSESVSVTSAIAKQINNFDSDIDLQIEKNIKGAPNIHMKGINVISDRSSNDLDISSAISGDSSFVKKKKEKVNTLKISKDNVSCASSKSSIMDSDVSSLNVNQSIFKGMDSDVSVDFRKKKTSKK